MSDGFESALQADLRDVELVNGQQLAGIAYPHVHDILLQGLARVFLEVAAGFMAVCEAISVRLMRCV